jgi:hypothetical protein
MSSKQGTAAGSSSTLIGSAARRPKSTVPPIVLCTHNGPHLRQAGCSKSSGELLAYVHDKVEEIHASLLPIMEDLVRLKVMVEHLYETAVEYQPPRDVEEGDDDEDDDALGDEEDDDEIEVEEIDL